jgi:hypothetical protein
MWKLESVHMLLPWLLLETHPSGDNPAVIGKCNIRHCGIIRQYGNGKIRSFPGGERV